MDGIIDLTNSPTTNKYTPTSSTSAANSIIVLDASDASEESESNSDDQMLQIFKKAATKTTVKKIPQTSSTTKSTMYLPLHIIEQDSKYTRVLKKIHSGYYAHSDEIVCHISSSFCLLKGSLTIPIPYVEETSTLYSFIWHRYPLEVYKYWKQEKDATKWVRRCSNTPCQTTTIYSMILYYHLTNLSQLETLLKLLHDHYINYKVLLLCNLDVSADVKFQAYNYQYNHVSVKVVNTIDNIIDIVNNVHTIIAKSMYQYEDTLLSITLTTRSASMKVASKSKNVWLMTLIQFPNLSEKKARAIIQYYPTCASLLLKYNQCTTEKECQQVLKNITYTNAGRTIGPKLSKSIYNFFHSDGI